MLLLTFIPRIILELVALDLEISKQTDSWWEGASRERSAIWGRLLVPDPFPCPLRVSEGCVVHPAQLSSHPGCWGSWSPGERRGHALRPQLHPNFICFHFSWLNCHLKKLFFPPFGGFGSSLKESLSSRLTYEKPSKEVCAGGQGSSTCCCHPVGQAGPPATLL